jgi:hypothetical protein
MHENVALMETDIAGREKLPADIRLGYPIRIVGGNGESRMTEAAKATIQASKPGKSLAPGSPAADEIDPDRALIEKGGENVAGVRRL